MPPRLLTGITLLFWGAMTGHPLLGLLAAFVLEARSWISLRWNFSNITYVRAWHYSILCGALIAILAWMNGMKAGKIHTLFVWAPLILLPIELAMRYGKAKTIPLNTFSFFARKKFQQDNKLGRITSPRMVNTGPAYIATVLLATSMGSQNELYHFIGLGLIAAIALWANGRHSGFRPVAWSVFLILMLSFSLLGQWGMLRLYDYYLSAGNNPSPGRDISANESRTSIGRLGKLKLSSRIFWRMQVHEGKIPRLLRLATYNQYSRGTWKYKFKLSENETQRDDKGYLTADDISTPTLDMRVFHRVDPKLKQPTPPPTPDSFPPVSNISLIGEINARSLENPIPIPHFMQAIGGIGQLGPEASLESNPLGTVRLANPDYNVIEYHAWIGEHSTTEEVKTEYDLTVPKSERDAIRRTADLLGLNDPHLSTDQKILRLRAFFTTRFTYTTHLTTPPLSRNGRNSAIGSFLESTHSGHCEYFATATTLLLRESGVPARYCIGFSASELDKDHDEWVMRGKHAHAWCRVWMGDHWEDVDLTPPSWESLEISGGNPWQRKLADRWQRFREDFLIWRTHKSNQSRVITTITIVISLLTLWIIWRLWKSRQPQQKSKFSRSFSAKDAPITPLNQLEPKLSKFLSPRPIGTPLTQWLQGLTMIDPSLAPLITEISYHHSALRFDPDPKNTPHHQSQLSPLCKELQQHIKSKSFRQRIR